MITAVIWKKVLTRKAKVDQAEGLCHRIETWDEFHNPQSLMYQNEILQAAWDCYLLLLLVPWTENHLSSFKCGFLNIFSRQNLLCSLSSLLFLLRWNKNGAEKCLKNHIPFDFWDDSTSANQRAGKTIKKPLKEFPWNQQTGRSPRKKVCNRGWGWIRPLGLCHRSDLIFWRLNVETKSLLYHKFA